MGRRRKGRQRWRHRRQNNPHTAPNEKGGDAQQRNGSDDGANTSPPPLKDKTKEPQVTYNIACAYTDTPDKPADDSSRAITRLTRWLVIWTGLLFAATVGTGIVLYFQLETFKKTDESAHTSAGNVFSTNGVPAAYNGDTEENAE